MLLENFHKACQGNISGVNFNGATNGSISITSYPTNGAWYENNVNGRYVDVGFGNTAVSKDDYKLANSNTIDNRMLTWLASQAVNASPAISTVIATYRNDTATDITVTEIGLVLKNSTSVSNPVNNFLIARKVLDTPIVVPSGVTMAFTYSIELDFSESVSAS